MPVSILHHVVILNRDFNRLWIAFAMILTARVPSLIAADAVPRIDEVRLARDIVPRFGHVELTFRVAGTWENPFDPDDVSVTAEIVAPDRRVTVDGFPYQDYRLEGDTMVSVGEMVWKVRYAPTVAGRHTVQLAVRTRDGSAAAGPISFDCEEGAVRGFIEVSRTNPHYFARPDGTTFFPIGHNILYPSGIGRGRAVQKHDRLFDELASHGGNFVRTWWCVPGYTVEAQAEGTAAGRGRMDLASAWLIDRTVEQAEKLGIELMCCLEYQGNFVANHFWSRSPYNRVNGGPIGQPEAFFTDPEAARMFRLRLRYLVARWSYSTAIFSWQFFNEVNSSPNFHAEPVARWHEAMTAYLRSIDPNPHLIHTNLSRLNGIRKINALPELDIVSTNIYYQRDGALTADWTQAFARTLTKPYLLTEFGQAKYEDKRDCDVTGVLLNNTLWGQTVTGGAGSGLAWWWDSWIDAHNLHPRYRVLADFIAGMRFAEGAWTTVKAGSLDFAESGRSSQSGSSLIEQWRRNFEPLPATDGRPSIIHVEADGSFDRRDEFMGQVYDPEHMPDWLSGDARNFWAYGPRSFDITWPVNGFVDVIVPEIDKSPNPVLRVSLDGEEVLRRPLVVVDSLAREPGEDYFQRFRFAVKAGPHRLTVENVGRGFFTFALRLVNHRVVNGPDLQIRGLQSGDQMLLWLRHPEFNWLYDRVGIRPVRQRAGRLILTDVPAGTWRARWIDTLTGAQLGEETVRTVWGQLQVAVPEIDASAACRLDRENSG